MATLLLMGSWVKEEEKESEGRGEGQFNNLH